MIDALSGGAPEADGRERQQRGSNSDTRHVCATPRVVCYVGATFNQLSRTVARG